jgi:hypothetical protein
MSFVTTPVTGVRTPSAHGIYPAIRAVGVTALFVIITEDEE